MGRIFLQQGELEPAIDYLRQAVKLDYSNFRAHYALGRALSQAGQIEEAQKEFDLSKQFGGDSP